MGNEHVLHDIDEATERKMEENTVISQDVLRYLARNLIFSSSAFPPMRARYEEYIAYSLSV